MEIAIWDTYVTRTDGRIMHFDIAVPKNITDKELIYSFGKEYLKLKGQESQPLSSKECKFCHVEKLRPHKEEEIKMKGYFIIEMENCD